MTTLQEAAKVQGISHTCTQALTCADGKSVPAAAGGACYSYFTDTRAGWQSNDFGKRPGWNMQYLSGGNGVPLETRYNNDAHDLANPCTLHEVGTVFVRASPVTHFRDGPGGTPARLGDASHVVARVTAKLVPGSYRSPRCPLAPTAYVTVDFHVSFGQPGTGDEKGRKYLLLGTILFGNSGTNVLGLPSSSVVFWDGGDGRTLLHGDQLQQMGVASLPPLNEQYQTYNIDVKKLLQASAKPPPGYNFDDARIEGLDVYSSVRGGDIDFVVKNIDLAGY
jgi:hypothetical protein